MAATIHVTVTNGVRFPGYALPGTPAGTAPTAGIIAVSTSLFHVKITKRKIKGTRKKKMITKKELQLDL